MSLNKFECSHPIKIFFFLWICLFLSVRQLQIEIHPAIADLVHGTHFYWVNHIRIVSTIDASSRSCEWSFLNCTFRKYCAHNILIGFQETTDNFSNRKYICSVRFSHLRKVLLTVCVKQFRAGLLRATPDLQTRTLQQAPKIHFGWAVMIWCLLLENDYTAHFVLCCNS